jgi:hypothetical protein
MGFTHRILMCDDVSIKLTLTITSTEKAVTASNHVEGVCRDHKTVSSVIGAITKKIQTSRARMCFFLK